MTSSFPALALLLLLAWPHPVLAGGVPQADAGEPAQMKPYRETVAGTKVEIDLVPIPAGTEGFPAVFTMGSPASEEGRGADEGPQRKVRVEPFWIGKCEITWDTYREFRREYSKAVEHKLMKESTPPEKWLDAVSIPTPLWEQDSAPILQGLGTDDGYPVANITQFAARQFTKWLSRKTGRFYRLPTEAEWEFVARAGTSTPYSFGSDPQQLEEHAWTFDNSAYEDPDKGYPGAGAGYRKVGLKKANPWGVHDLYGNVSEWVIDQYDPKGYRALEGEPLPFMKTVVWPKEIFPCVARGGNWESEPTACRSAARLASSPDWQYRDPQVPRSIWWFTDGFHVGFRILRPLAVPDQALQERFWESESEDVQDIMSDGGKQVRVPIQRAGEGEKK